MSYILEALKKLERKRQREEKRPTLTLADATMPEARPMARWLTLVAVGLILNAMVLVWWIVFRGPYQPPRSAPRPPQRALVKPVPTAVAPPRDLSRPGRRPPEDGRGADPDSGGIQGPGEPESLCRPSGEIAGFRPGQDGNASREAAPVSGDSQESGGPAPSRTAPKRGCRRPNR